MMLFDQEGRLHVVPSNMVTIVESADLVITGEDGPVIVRGGLVRGTELSSRGLAALQRHGLLSDLFDTEPGGWCLEGEPDTPDVTAALDAVCGSALELHAPVADYCCGVGRISAPLLERGVRVCGIDISEYPVSRARSDIAARGLGDRFDTFVADVASFARPRFFGGAIAAANSLRYLGSHGRILRHLRLAAISLLPRARYALEVDTYSEVAGSTWKIPKGEMTWEVLSVDTLARETLERVTVRDQAGAVVHREFQSQVSITSDQLVQAAQESGLDLVDAWDKQGHHVPWQSLARKRGNIWYVFERRLEEQ
jgi:SAM-dependent methyltransferase